MALLATCSFLARASASMFRIRLVGGDDPGALQLASSFLQDPIRAVTTDYLRIEANFGVEEVHRLSKFLLSSKALNCLFLLIALSCLRFAAVPFSSHVTTSSKATEMPRRGGGGAHGRAPGRVHRRRLHR
ncbi:unnamed protein product [Polarella glacialis]|nr:unnamed protein product [Polarella glacialis]